MDTLPAFVKTLQDRHMVDLNNIIGDTEENFNNRLKIQKYVYLARCFNLDMHYDYNMYLHGPYSPKLAEDYYKLAESPQILDRPGNVHIHDDFFKSIGNREPEWLEIATTLLSLSEFFKERASLLDRASNMKAHIPSENIELVLKELERLKLIKF